MRWVQVRKVNVWYIALFMAAWSTMMMVLAIFVLILADNPPASDAWPLFLLNPIAGGLSGLLLGFAFNLVAAITGGPVLAVEDCRPHWPQGSMRIPRPGELEPVDRDLFDDPEEFEDADRETRRSPTERDEP